MGKAPAVRVAVAFDCEWLHDKPRPPEETLLAAVLELAMSDAIAPTTVYGNGNGSSKNRIHANAIEWLTSTDEDAWEISFQDCCDALFADPDGMRDKILREVLKRRAENRQFNRRNFKRLKRS